MVKTSYLIWQRLQVIIIAISLFTFSSCIEIVETITINKDLSGKVKYSIETSELAALLNNFSGIIDDAYDKEIERAINNYVSVLEKEDGISNVLYIIDKRKGDYGFSFDFENTGKLNTALYNISGSKKGFFSPSYLKASKKRLKKLNIAPWVRKYLERENIEIPERGITDVIDFKSVYILPGKINSVSNKKAKINDDGQRVITSFPLTDVIENRVNSGIKIRFRSNK